VVAILYLALLHQLAVVVGLLKHNLLVLEVLVAVREGVELLEHLVMEYLVKVMLEGVLLLAQVIMAVAVVVRREQSA
jgi:hypothetical protein